jgi:hypothetical protein
MRKDAAMVRKTQGRPMSPVAGVVFTQLVIIARQIYSSRKV